MINKIFIAGRVGKDPDIRHLESGNTVASFSVATSERYKKNGEQVEETTWHNVVVWGKPAEIVEKYVSKGDLIHIEGKSKTRSWEKDGEKKYITEVVVDFDGKVTLMPKAVNKPADSETAADTISTLGSKVTTAAVYDTPVDAEVVDEDDIPF